MPWVGEGVAVLDIGAWKGFLKRRHLIRDMNEETGPGMLRSGRACVCVCVTVSTGRTVYSHHVLCRLVHTWGAEFIWPHNRGDRKCNGTRQGVAWLV